MARLKSDDKRKAILEAATTLFAERGVWATPTAAISKAAGVAEGTLFTYFDTKVALANALYRALKVELAEALLADFPQKATLRNKLRHLWERYVRWGAANPEKLKVLAQLGGSEQITEESHAAGSAAFAEIERLANDSLERKLIHPYPVAYIAALFNSMAETTMAAMAAGGEVDYCAAGFEVFWRGIARR